MNNKRIIVGILALMLIMSGILFAQSFEVIAVHFGNPDYAEALTQENFPGFKFYTTDGNCYRYREQQVLVLKNPEYLFGYYGEIPEKMGFTANYTTEKGSETPFPEGVIYVVGKNGVISTQTSAMNKLNGSSEMYWEDYNKLKKEMKRLKKGKTKDLLKAKDRVYLKSTPIGEREPYKKTKVDKKGEGLVGWNVPEVTVYDTEGKAHKLNTLTKDKNCVLVFYTMDGVHQVEASRKDGTILKEWDDIMPVDREKEMKAATENPEDPKELLKAFAKTMGESISGVYEESIGGLEMAKQLIEAVK